MIYIGTLLTPMRAWQLPGFNLEEIKELRRQAEICGLMHNWSNICTCGYFFPPTLTEYHAATCPYVSGIMTVIQFLASSRAQENPLVCIGEHE